MDNEIILLKIGAIIQQGLLGEAQAPRDYNTQLADIAELSPEIAEKCSEVISEIIADELDHERKLWQLYQTITGIPANEN